MAEVVTITDRSTFDYWYEKYDGLVHAVLFRNGIVPIEDGVQEVWLDFWSRRYFDIYDPSKGSESNFLWCFTERRSRGMRTRQGRNPVHGALSLVDDPAIYSRGEVDISRNLAFSTTDKVESWMMIQGVRAALKALPIEGKRDLARLFDLLVAGFDQKTIAKIMQVAEGTVSHAVTDLRKVPQVRELMAL